MPIRVMLADDHPMVLVGIKNILAVQEDIQVIAEATNGLDVLNLVDRFQPDVLVLDMSLPGLDGLEVTRQLKAGGATVKILALSGYNDREYILGTLDEGASGYLSKDESIESIQDAIRGVAVGQYGWISREAKAVLMEAYQVKGVPELRLTRRETQVSQLVIEGKTNSQIGVELKISEKTVEKYLQNLFEKFQVSSRVGLAVFLVRKDG